MTVLSLADQFDDEGYDLDGMCVWVSLVEVVMPVLAHNPNYDVDEDEGELRDEAADVIRALVNDGAIRREDFEYADGHHRRRHP